MDGLGGPQPHLRTAARDRIVALQVDVGVVPVVHHVADHEYAGIIGGVRMLAHWVRQERVESENSVYRSWSL